MVYKCLFASLLPTFLHMSLEEGFLGHMVILWVPLKKSDMIFLAAAALDIPTSNALIKPNTTNK
jgi:hypothetical protein